MTTDSTASYADYAKRAVELGHKVICSLEHGWQGYYYETFEIANNYQTPDEKSKLKFIFGTEAYWVKDRLSKDKTNCHIVILAKSEIGRRAINKILSIANKDGYYYKPRIDTELILSLPPTEVFVTTACIGFWHYEDIKKYIIKFRNHFKENFYLEIQNHNTLKQIELNKKIKSLSKEYNIEMIVGLDSHYIYEEDSIKRKNLLYTKQIVYDDEDGWFMDYPDDNTVIERFLKQNVFTKEEVINAMNVTDRLLDFDDIEFNTDIKLPNLYKDKTLDERNEIFKGIIQKEWNIYKKQLPTDTDLMPRINGIVHEVNTIIETGMVDYFLIDYEIVKEALKHDGMITNSGRGSAVSYLVNKLLGFSDVDRFNSPIKIYPERFISKERILETRSLPDLDLNLGNPEVFEEAQRKVMGENHSYPMIAFGTLKKKSAWQMYAKSQDIPFETANEISKQLGNYDKAMHYAEDDEKDLIIIEDYVEEKYLDLVAESEQYQGIIADKKRAPCAYLIYDGDIESEIGLIKCKSESTNKEYIVTVIDGKIAEKYKFLKNDLLKVDVVLLINKIYRKIGIKPHTVNELMKIIEEDKDIWDIYHKGITVGVNQIERESTKRKCMRYKPTNISELTAFIAAIRPSFKSMYEKFENREEFSYGIKALDKILQTEQFPYSYILYQEQIMNVLNYADFPIGKCYGVLKDISKKKSDKIVALNDKFVKSFKKEILSSDDSLSEKEAITMTQDVWQLVKDFSGYGFNSSHAVCMAIDSLYMAYLKSHYPYEFYEVMLQVYSDKGKKDKVLDCIKEMKKYFGIKLGEYKFGADNTKFRMDKKNEIIYPALIGIKNIGKKAVDIIDSMSKNRKYKNFYDFCIDYKTNPKIDKQQLGTGQLKILININYFSDFGGMNKLNKFYTAFNVLYERHSFKKDDFINGKINAEYLEIVKKHSKETFKQYTQFNYKCALKEYLYSLPDEKISIIQKIKNEYAHTGNIMTIDESMIGFALVIFLDVKYAPKINYYSIRLGEYFDAKISKRIFNCNKFGVGDVIKINKHHFKPQVKRTSDGTYEEIPNTKQMWIDKYIKVC